MDEKTAWKSLPTPSYFTNSAKVIIPENINNIQVKPKAIYSGIAIVL